MTNGAGWSKLHPFSLSPSQCVLPSHSNKTTPLLARHWSSYQVSYQISLWNVHRDACCIIKDNKNAIVPPENRLVLWVMPFILLLILYGYTE